MNTRLQAAIALAVIGLSTAGVIHRAGACGLTNMGSSAARHWSLPAYLPSSNAAKSVAQTPASGKVSPEFNLLQILEPITGFYQFTFTAEGNAGGPPDGTPIDAGFVTWHADGTEIMNSGKPPAGGNFCMGAWVRTGVNTYKLNHYALNWTDDGKTFIGPVNIRENVTLAHGGNSYSGSFTLNQYAPDGTTLLGGVQGTVSATRITVDSN